MKSQFQQFQQQQQQLQQQRQRMAQGAEWMEQQNRAQQQMAAQAGPVVQKDVDQRFSLVEQEAARFRQQFAAGKLSQDALSKKLSELMVQDAAGTWWMVGTESGRWYRYDGTRWVPGTPPGRGAAAAKPIAGVNVKPKRGGSKLSALITLFWGIPLSIGAFYAFGWGSYQILLDIVDDEISGPASGVIGIAAGIICLFLVIRQARKEARGY